MKINLETELHTLSGETFKNEKGEDFSLKEAMKRAALAEFQGETLSPEQKFHKYEIAKKLVKSENSIELSSEDISIIKKNASKAFNVELYGVICDILESCVPVAVTNIKYVAPATK